MQIVVQVQSNSQSKLSFFYFFFISFLPFFNIQTFLYIIMNIFITLLENVNKSRN
jgi:hypothetical protein